MKLALVPPAGKKSYTCSVYNYPEAYGLTIVASLDYDNDASYGFDWRVVWSDAEGRLWTARDSGCSCPVPFENTTELDRVFNLDELDKERRSEMARGNRAPDVAEWAAFRAEVVAALARLSGAR